MKLRTILASFAAALLAGCAQAQPADDVLLQMQQAYSQGNRARLTQLLPAAQGHVLEPWAAYWELRARLGAAAPSEVQAFLTRYAGTYQEDRLRNDWLLLLGQRRDWDNFAQEIHRYRMNDDRELRCYALAAQHLREGAAAPAGLADEVRRLWLAQREADDGCTFAASRLIGERVGRNRMTEADAWRKARQSVEHNRPRAAAAAVEIVHPESLPLLAELQASPAKFLRTKVVAVSRVRREIIGLALIKLATS
ncbi:MAG TPA: lytic transglycosylase domain-containing protein, partial [Ramlibacter sp.]